MVSISDELRDEAESIAKLTGDVSLMSDLKALGAEREDLLIRLQGMDYGDAVAEVLLERELSLRDQITLATKYQSAQFDRTHHEIEERIAKDRASRIKRVKMMRETHDFLIKSGRDSPISLQHLDMDSAEKDTPVDAIRRQNVARKRFIGTEITKSMRTLLRTCAWRRRWTIFRKHRARFFWGFIVLTIAVGWVQNALALSVIGGIAVALLVWLVMEYAIQPRLDVHLSEKHRDDLYELIERFYVESMKARCLLALANYQT